MATLEGNDSHGIILCLALSTENVDLCFEKQQPYLITMAHIVVYSMVTVVLQ